MLRHPLLELAFDLRDELLTAAVDVVLGVEQSATLGIVLGLQGLNLLLPGQLFHTI